MKPIQLVASLSALGLVTACVPQPKPTPPVQARPTPAPAPAPAPPPPIANWMDTPATPGDWSYAGGTARFAQNTAQPIFSMRCDPADRAIVLTSAGAGNPGGVSQMVIRAETQTRALPAVASPGPPAGMMARLPASDRLLDAMALSKGRFAVEVAGVPTLYLPSWAEVTRVIEDCR